MTAPMPPDPHEEIAALRADIAALRERVAALERRLGDAAEDGSAAEEAPPGGAMAAIEPDEPWGLNPPAGPAAP